jgi:carboxymethylenebutenolidase
MCNPASNYWPGTEKRPGENITLKSREGSEFTVHVSRPAGDGPHPAMLIIHDYFDPDDYYFDLADQYAAAGYLSVCPDLFHRQGDLSEQSHEKAGERIGAVGDDQAIEDLEVVLEHLQGQGSMGDLAVTGFCWGGRIAYLFAARHPEVKALVVMYGHLTAWSGPDGNKQYSPLDEAARIDARVIGSYGGGDEAIPLEQVSDMEKRLQARGVRAELKVYDGAPHCFFRTPEWKQASDDVWSRVLSGLKETVG